MTTVTNDSALDAGPLMAAWRRGSAPIAALADLGGISQQQAAARLAHHFSMQLLSTADMAEMTSAFDRLPLAEAQRRNLVLLRSDPAGSTPHESDFVAVTSNPFDVDLLTRAEYLAGGPTRQALATAQDIQAYLRRQEALVRTVDTLAHANVPATVANPARVEVLSLASVADAGSPAVALVSSTIYDALRVGASDVHLESTPEGLSVRFRLDGVLDNVTRAAGIPLAEQVISRLKVLAELDISERRVPQDGSFRVHALGRPVDLRVSIMPSIHGEDAVVRILDKQAILASHGQLTLEALGFEPQLLDSLREMIDAPFGMVLVAGPTGSGKTTTLYAALSESRSDRDKIITIEDPVEYQLSGVLQIPVNEKKGLTFARGLRSILRHDPDKIMVGEIRDRETAEIAVQSALTGHLVFSTVHANSVFDIFGRFTHMGLDPYSLVSALHGVWAQRLVRLNCASCRTGDSPGADELRRSKLIQERAREYEFQRGAGCGHCRGTGFRGRKAIAEVLKLDDELLELIVDKQPMRRIRECAAKKGTRSLTEAALDLVRRGETTLSEVRRVTLVE